MVLETAPWLIQKSRAEPNADSLQLVVNATLVNGEVVSRTSESSSVIPDTSSSFK